VAAVRPPVERRLVLAGLDETIDGPAGTFELGVHRYPDAAGSLEPGVHHPRGDRHLEGFDRWPFPRHTWLAGPYRFERRVIVIHGFNAVLLRYRLLDADAAVRLEMTPLTAFRDHHDNRHESASPAQLATAGPTGADTLTLRPADGGEELVLHTFGGALDWRPGPFWLRNVVHHREVERGLDPVDDLFAAGRLAVTLEPGAGVDLLVSLGPLPPGSPDALEAAELARRAALLKPVRRSPRWVRALHLAADQFLVRRGAAQRTIMAGYPWFTDWGRDSMIALPGLCLATGRLDEAGEILSTFAAHLRDGLLPNHFPDAGDAPEYNTLDASLWFFQAIRQYLAAGGSVDRVRKDLYPAGREIVTRYPAGTHYGIHADADGLITWAWPNTALTWMDARVEDWAVTPRQGKPVEIQALWHAALLEMAGLAERFRDKAAAATWRAEAARVRRAFRAAFWNESLGYLHDVIAPDGTPDPAIRPNALFAVSLPYDLLSMEEGRRIVATATRELYAGTGLRSLAPGEPAYAPIYVGDRWRRDAAYHQGTSWGWLLGPYLEALWRTSPDRKHAAATVERLLEAGARHLFEDGIGSWAEVFDAEPPHAPRGCPAQAWSVAEPLRLLALVAGKPGG
jgi:predicted glycogen debranching enzyme